MIRSIIILSIIHVFTASALADEYNIIQLTDNDYADYHPKINNTGQVVWSGCAYCFAIPFSPESGARGLSNNFSGPGVFLYDNNTVIRLTDDTFNDHGDNYPQINSQAWVVWNEAAPGGYYNIYLYDGSSIIQLTNTSNSERLPRINNKGHVVWASDRSGIPDREFLYYDGNTITQLTDKADKWDSGPAALNDHGQVVWSATDGSDLEIFLYDGSSILQLTDNDLEDTHPSINNQGHVVWTGNTPSLPSSSEIFLYNGHSTTQLTNNELYDYGPLINDNGQVVWHGRQIVTGDRAIYFYDGLTTLKIADSIGDCLNLTNSGRVFWIDSAGSSRQVFCYDGHTTRQITYDSSWKAELDVNDHGQIVWTGHQQGKPESREIFLAMPRSESSAAAIPGMTEWGIFLLISLLGLRGFWTLRRRKAM